MLALDHFKPDPAPLPAEPEDSSDDSDSDTHAEFVAGKVEGASIGFEELSLSVLMRRENAHLLYCHFPMRRLSAHRAISPLNHPFTDFNGSLTDSFNNSLGYLASILTPNLLHGFPAACRNLGVFKTTPYHLPLSEILTVLGHPVPSRTRPFHDPNNLLAMAVRMLTRTVAVAAPQLNCAFHIGTAQLTLLFLGILCIRTR
ncbi:hypothetical protein B0H13DRAFT_1877886 [Mycena leptocephala]|nr:hypothetical protein B0H13DRAFT_1877886 [Mycena leptocephala]